MMSLIGIAGRSPVGTAEHCYLQRNRRPLSQFMDTLRDKLRVKQYSYKTEKAYLDWTKRFIRFHQLQPPQRNGESRNRSIFDPPGENERQREYPHLPWQAVPGKPGTPGDPVYVSGNAPYHV